MECTDWKWSDGTDLNLAIRSCGRSPAIGVISTVPRFVAPHCQAPSAEASVGRMKAGEKNAVHPLAPRSTEISYGRGISDSRPAKALLKRSANSLQRKKDLPIFVLDG